MIWWSTWSELGGAARDVVDVVWWSRWSELGGAARDVVWWSELGGAARDVVDVVWARRSRLRRGRRGSLSSSYGSLVGSAWLAYGLAGSLDGSTWLI